MAMFRVSWTMAALDTGYVHRPICATLELMEVRLTIEPPPRLTMCGRTA